MSLGNTNEIPSARKIQFHELMPSKGGTVPLSPKVSTPYYWEFLGMFHRGSGAVLLALYASLPLDCNNTSAYDVMKLCLPHASNLQEPLTLLARGCLG